jgi:hypothetical protein
LFIFFSCCAFKSLASALESNFVIYHRQRV